jgi:hypothetical protein
MANDGPGQCLSDANDAKTSKCSGVHRIWITPSYIVDPTKTGVYKQVAEPQLFLSQLMDFKEARAPVKKQEEHEGGHTIHCD